MKKLVVFVCVLFGFVLKSNAQLRVSPYTYNIYADTATANTLDSADVWIINDSAIVFADFLNIAVDVQDSVGILFHNVDSLNFGFMNIPAFDSVPLRIYQNFIIAPQKYHYDINVIVIWPYTISTGNGDSLFFPVYISIPNGINEVDISKYIKAYPNPSEGNVFMDSQYDIEEVTVYNLSGQILLHQKNTKLINIEALPKGTYLFDVKMKNEKHYKLKIMRQ